MTIDHRNLDELAAENVVIKLLLRAMRDGSGMSLESATSEMLTFPGAVPEAVRAAEQLIRARQEQIQAAQTPRAVVAGNIESWYSGPRAEDPNWSALLETLRRSGWTDAALTDLDDASTKIVAHLPNPHDKSEYHCRGLVLGYVQSGKTTNFTAVIAKAADAGYRFFIVLSGLHNALRWQTQDRLNQQLWMSHEDRWHRLTDTDDFRATANVDALLSTGGHQRVLAVVKKHGTVLRRLKRWLNGARPELLASCPILIVDDEADQASVNTAKMNGRPSTINGLIRDIVNGSPKAAYVGYTATPFANVLIDPTNDEDLYPRDFIIDLPKPDVYIGPETIFGREPLEFDADDLEDDGHDFIRSVSVNELGGLRPKGASTRHDFTPDVTESLDAALRYFLLSTAARRIRGVGNPHATALVHTSQHIDVHERTAVLLGIHLKEISRRIDAGDVKLLGEMAAMWEEECGRVPAGSFGLATIPWTQIRGEVGRIAQQAEVIVDNSRSTERLSFDDDNPRVIVAVGGNTLSRGLTLEGLAVSYFVRTASAYDTLLQMGRWFGYRNGYADLTRIWMPDEMREWFHHLATVEQEIRFDVARYESDHLTPIELAPRLRTHPKLAITAAAKMQSARTTQASYSGRRLQTILFNHRDRHWLNSNLEAARSLIGALEANDRRKVRSGIQVIEAVDSERILEFLAAYRFHENSRDLNSELISRYIRQRRAENELTHFRVAIMSRESERADLGSVDLGLGSPVACINRSRLKSLGGSTYADVKALMSKVDRAIDLSIPADELDGLNQGEIARLRNAPENGGRGDGSGLLLLYPVSKDSRPMRASATTREELHAVADVIGVGLVFPESQSRKAGVNYMTANIDALSDDVEEPDEDDVPEDLQE